MDTIRLLKHQLVVVNEFLQEVVEDMTVAEWVTRPLVGGNLLGFEIWHVAATQDWCVQSWIRGVVEVRERPLWADWAGIEQASIPFGITLATADAVTRSMQSSQVAAYAQAVLDENLAWLDTLADEDLDHIPDVRAHHPHHLLYETAGYRGEVADMWQESIWELLSGAVLAHAESEAAAFGRRHFGLEVPMVNETAVTYLLQRGFQMDSFLAYWMCDRPFGKLENYIVTAPPFFL